MSDAECTGREIPTTVSNAAPNVQSAGAASYFDNYHAAQKLAREATSWIGTPFREYYQQDMEKGADVKGMGGGIDCVGLVQEIMARTGASQAFVFKRDPADYQSHQLGDKILDWLRGKVDDPQSKTLGQILQELEIPEKYKESPRTFFKPGDILVLRHGSLFHMPVIYDNELHFVNSIPRRGVVEGTIQDTTFNQHLVAVFRLKPKA